MAKVSREQAELNHEKIEASAAHLFRERGLNGISVADVMADAGLTHGGFYGHFASKDALAESACTRAFDQSRDRWNSLADNAGPEGKLMAIARHYLSTSHRDHMGRGCAAGAFATDIAREDDAKPVRAIYAAGLARMVDQLEKMSSARGGTRKREAAIANLAMMVGALNLARATRNEAGGNEFSEEILESTLAVIKRLDDAAD